MNVVVLGAAIKHLGFTQEEIEEAIKSIFARKGELIVDANLRALQAGITATV
jgi:indolepyruvate ferredoxin oxidoreductase beta subunit